MKRTHMLVAAVSVALLLGGCGGGTERAGPEETDAPTLAAEPALPREAVIRAANEGDLIPFPLHPARSLAGPDTHEAAMSFFEIEVPAGTAGAPPHTHAYEDEFFYVREGRITFMAGEERRTIGAGGFVLLPRGGQHAFWNDTEDDATLLLGTSEGEFGDFFDAVAMAVREENAARPDEIGAIVGRLGAERGIAIDMSAVPGDVAGLYGLPGPE